MSESIDVKELLRRYTLEELLASADAYFAEADRSGLLRKPFNDLGEAPEVTLTFLQVLKILAQPAGATILDFGCGTAWTSAIMAGLGYKVIACDVSAHALKIASDAYADLDITYLLFDGRTLELGSQSVDAITCFSALHHVPNLDEVLGEIARVLRPLGVAGFSEPGPNHSRTPQSQREMQEFTVIENDIDIDGIWTVAQNLGFTNIEIGIFQPEPLPLTLSQFKSYLDGTNSQAFDSAMRTLMRERRMFFLEKGLPNVTTSLSHEGLDAVLTAPSRVSFPAGSDAVVRIDARNSGTALWRPSNWFSGPVRMGVTMIDSAGVEHPLPRCLLDTRDRYGVVPGNSAIIDFKLPECRPDQSYRLKFQMVSEFVAWFGKPLEVEVEIV